MSFSVPRDDLACLIDSGLDSEGRCRDRGRIVVGDQLVLVRVERGSHFKYSGKTPFVKVPYSISASKSRRETSGRSRGFKFALISGLAAYLTNSPRVICPERKGVHRTKYMATVGAFISGSDDIRRSASLRRMDVVRMKALLGSDVRYRFPRLWATKGETLSEFARLTETEAWKDAKSCCATVGGVPSPVRGGTAVCARHVC